MTDKKPFSLENYYNLKFITSASISKDGSKVAFSILTYHDIEKKNTDKEVFPKEERSNIWVIDTQTKETKEFTFDKVNLNPSWSPDGKSLAFISKRQDEKQIFLVSGTGGEAQQLTNIPVGVSSKPIWSPDGSKIVFSASSLAKTPDKDKPYRYTREFYRFDAAGSIDNFKHDIFVIDVLNKEMKQITTDERHHTNPRWSPDGSKLLWLSNFSSTGADAFLTVLTIYENGTLSNPISDWGFCNMAEWVTNEQVVFQGIQKGKKLGSKEDIYTLNLSNKLLDCRSEGCTLGIGGRIGGFMPGGEGRLNKLAVTENKVFTGVQNKGKMSLYSFTLKGEVNFAEVVGGERTCYLQDVANEKILFTSSQPNNPLDIFSVDLQSAKEEQLTFTNKDFLTNILLPETKKIDITCSDGVITEGWFLIPQDKAPYPTLLKIHGGPHAGLGYAFYWDAQVLSGSGYAVLMVNHRGSTGYGDEFATATNGDWGNLDYKDLMAGIDTGIKLGIINQERMGCFGISGGGNLSCWIVGQTDRFKAAVPENPLTNWLSFYGVSDIGRYFSVAEVGGLPHEKPDVYVKTSPISYAHKCKTPTLMIQHDNDLRCPPEQSEQFYAVLKEAGCIVEMLRMPGTPHGGSIVGPLRIREARSRALLEWFGKYV